MTPQKSLMNMSIELQAHKVTREEFLSAHIICFAHIHLTVVGFVRVFREKKLPRGRLDVNTRCAKELGCVSVGFESKGIHWHCDVPVAEAENFCRIASEQKAIAAPRTQQRSLPGPRAPLKRLTARTELIE